MAASNSTIQQFHAELDKLFGIIQSVHKAVETSNQERLTPGQKLQSDRQELPSNQASAKLALTEVTEMVGQVQVQLQQLETDLLTQATTLASEGNGGLETLESGSKVVQGLVQTLTASVHDALKATNSCTTDVDGAASKLVGDCESDSTHLGQSSTPAHTALETSDRIVKDTYNPALFAELAAALGDIQNQLNTATTTIVPTAVTNLSNELGAEHTQSVQASLKSLGTAAQEAQSGYLGAVQQNSTKMRQEMRDELDLTDKLVGKDLPQLAREATAKEADPGMRQMKQEASAAWTVTLNMAGYLDKAQDKYLEAVRELHLALKGMLR